MSTPSSLATNSRRTRIARRGLVVSALLAAAVGLGAWYWVTKMTGPTFREYAARWDILPVDYYFQLMYPPASSLAAFDRVGRGEPAGKGVLRYPFDDAALLSHGLGILAGPFLINDTAICLGFPNELGRWDVLRCSWQARGWHFEFAAHEFVWSLRVSGPGTEERSLETVRRVAETILPSWGGQAGAGIALKLVGDDGQVLFGVHDIIVREGRLTNWRDDVCWYHDGKAVSFISSEANSGQFIKVDEQRMRSWLEPYFNHVFFKTEWELMFPTAAERAALDALQAGRETPGVERVRADDSGMQDFPLLLPKLRVPADSQCLRFDVADDSPVVRCRYRAGEWHLDQTSSGVFRAVRVQPGAEAGSELERAEHAAARLFGHPFELEVLGHHEGKTFGTEKGAPPPSKSPEQLRWWVDSTGIGFVLH